MVSPPGKAGGGVQESYGVAPDTTPFVPSLSPGIVGEQLLTVREVAARLAVSTATVYALCERGQLRHVRVSNAIRIKPAEVEAFIADPSR